MHEYLPRIEINLSEIEENCRFIKSQFQKYDISLMGVTKCFLGEPKIAEAMIRGGADYLADSRIENLIRMKEAHLSSSFVLLRSSVSIAEKTVLNAEISFNSDFKTLQSLSYFARIHNRIHQVVLILEMGDLREGISANDIFEFVKITLELKNIEIIGVSCNWGCLKGYAPTDANMNIFSELSLFLQLKYNLNFKIISGGNSSNYHWLSSDLSKNSVNNLRIGELILLGIETLNGTRVSQLNQNVFNLHAEVIESRVKSDSSKLFPLRERTVVSLGYQDIDFENLIYSEDVEILGQSSDHTVLVSTKKEKKQFCFNLNYQGLLQVFTSPFVKKVFVYNC